MNKDTILPEGFGWCNLPPKDSWEKYFMDHPRHQMLAIKTLCKNDKCHFHEKVDRWGWKLEKEVLKYQGDPRCPAPNPCHFWWRTYEEYPMHFLIEKY